MPANETQPQTVGGNEFGHIPPVIVFDLELCTGQRKDLEPTAQEETPPAGDNDSPDHSEEPVISEVRSVPLGPPRPPVPGEYPHIRGVTERRRQRVFNAKIFKTQS